MPACFVSGRAPFKLKCVSGCVRVGDCDFMALSGSFWHVDSTAILAEAFFGVKGNVCAIYEVINNTTRGP